MPPFVCGRDQLINKDRYCHSTQQENLRIFGFVARYALCTRSEDRRFGLQGRYELSLFLACDAIYSRQDSTETTSVELLRSDYASCFLDTQALWLFKAVIEC